MSQRRLYVDAKELVAGYMDGKNSVTNNIVYDKIASIKVTYLKSPGLFGREGEAIEIHLRGNAKPIVYYQAQEKEFFKQYKTELEKFAKNNHIKFIDETQ